MRVLNNSTGIPPREDKPSRLDESAFRTNADPKKTDVDRGGDKQPIFLVAPARGRFELGALDELGTGLSGRSDGAVNPVFAAAAKLYGTTWTERSTREWRR